MKNQIILIIVILQCIGLSEQRTKDSKTSCEAGCQNTYKTQCDQTCQDNFTNDCLQGLLSNKNCEEAGRLERRNNFLIQNKIISSSKDDLSKEYLGHWIKCWDKCVDKLSNSLEKRYARCLRDCKQSIMQYSLALGILGMFILLSVLN